LLAEFIGGDILGRAERTGNTEEVAMRVHGETTSSNAIVAGEGIEGGRCPSGLRG
jgi:hypothetical protein